MYLVERNKFILAGLIVSILSILGLAFYSQWEIDNIFKHSSELGENYLRKQYLITQLEKLVDNMEAEEDRYLLTGDTHFKEAYNQVKEEIDYIFEEFLGYLPKKALVPQELHTAKDLLTLWQHSREQHETGVRRIADHIRSSRVEPFSIVKSQKIVDMEMAVRGMLEKINFDLNEQRMDKLQAIDRLSRNLAIRNWLLVAVVIAVVAVMEAIALLRLWKLERSEEHLREDEAKLQAMIIELQAATRLKSEFLSNVSHEIRTPLNAIIGFVQVMQKEMYGPLNDKQKDRLAYVHNGGQHLLSLINDILDLSKVEAGKMDLESTSFSLPELLQHSLNTFQEKARIHNIDLSLKIDKHMSPITADRRKFQQIVYNLLSNALKFTPPGGRITLESRIIANTQMPSVFLGNQEADQRLGPSNSKIFPSQRSLLISVKDTGIGIPTSELTNIFEPFRQVDGSHIRKFEGSGLGLSLVKRFVELHGGSTWAESSGPDKGAAFFFTLPLESSIAAYAKN